MSTLGQMIASIREDINRGTDFDARIQRAIVSAISYYKGRKYTFNVSRQTNLVTAEFTSLSVDMLTIEHARLQINGTNVRNLIPRTTAWMNERDDNETETGEPIYYAVENRQLRLHPAPDQSYSVELYGHMDLQEISISTSSSTATNAWMTHGADLIRNHATAEVLAVYIKGDEALRDAEVHRQLAKQYNDELVRQFNAQARAAEITPLL